MLFPPPFSEDILSEINQQAESDGVGERVIILESIKLTEVNAKDVVSKPCTQSNKFPVTIFRMLVVVSVSKRKKVVIPIFQAESKHQLLDNRHIHGYCSFKPLDGSQVIVYSY